MEGGQVGSVAHRLVTREPSHTTPSHEVPQGSVPVQLPSATSMLWPNSVSASAARCREQERNLRRFSEGGKSRHKFSQNERARSSLVRRCEFVSPLRTATPCFVCGGAPKRIEHASKLNKVESVHQTSTIFEQQTQSNEADIQYFIKTLALVSLTGIINTLLTTVSRTQRYRVSNSITVSIYQYPSPNYDPRNNTS